VALFFATRWIGTELFDEEIGEWGALMFATIPATFALGSIGVFDMVFCAFLFGGVGAVLVSAVRERPRLQYPGFALIALAALTKGPVAILLVALFVCAASLSSARSRQLFLALDWKRGAAIVLLISLPWFAWMYRFFGARFIEAYLFAGNLWYFTQPPQFSSRTVSHTFYVRTILGGFFPWSILTIARGVDIIRRWRHRRALPSAEVLLWFWILVVVGFFSLARFKLDTYIFPAAPACCLLAARGWRTALNEQHTAAARLSVLLIGLLLAALGAAAIVALFQMDLGLPAGAAILPIALITGGGITVAQALRNGLAAPRSLTAPFITLLVVYATTALVAFPTLEQTRSAVSTARFIRAQPVGAVALYRVDRWKSSLRYYVGRRIDTLHEPEELKAFLRSSNPTYVVMLRDEYERLFAIGLPVEVISSQPIVSATSGRGFRRQIWNQLVVVRKSVLLG
jgi:4-amino-4-deoxy-L-arabinose transferase-like glycosyltransferase